VHNYGHAEQGDDQRAWEPIVKTWFTEGANDPRITAIKITPEEGY